MLVSCSIRFAKMPVRRKGSFLQSKVIKFYIFQENTEQGELENVRVVVRVRPMDKQEIESGTQNIVKVDKINRSVTVLKPGATANEPPKTYYFDNVFGEDSSQVSAMLDCIVAGMKQLFIFR